MLICFLSLVPCDSFLGNEVASSVFIGFTDLILCATRTRVADKPFTEDIKLMGFPQEIQSVCSIEIFFLPLYCYALSS